MPREPLLLPFACLICGIFAASRFAPPLFPLLALAFLALIAAVALRRYPVPKTGCALVTCLLAGMATEVGHKPGTPPKLNVEDGETAILSGCVSNPPVFSPDREQFTLDLAPRASARVTLPLKAGATVPLAYGQRVETAAKIRSPRNFGNPDGFDYQGYLAAQDIYWTASVTNASDIRTLPGRCGSQAVGWLFAVRTWALERLRGLYPGDPHTAALLAATLLGDTTGVERRWTEDFRATGTYHALVISGQHVSVLALTILTLLKLLRMRRIPALMVAAAVCWMYAFISGGSSPVIRAAGGFSLFLIASYVFRRTRILNILAAIGIVYLILEPRELWDPSFQLSFLSAAAIAAFAIPLMERFTEPLRAATKYFGQTRYDPRVDGRAAQWRVELRLITRTLQVWSRTPNTVCERIVVCAAIVAAFIVDAIAVSACVQFGLALPMISYFHRLSITGLSANVVVIPLFSAIVPLGFGSIVTGSHALGWCTKQLLLLAEACASWHVHFEPVWRLAALPLWLSVGFAASLVGLACAVRLQRRMVAPLLACAIAFFLLACFQPWRALLRPGMLEVTAIDVSQGDSIFVAFPDGKTMLVDAGGFPGAGRMAHKPQLDMGEDVVAPYL